MSFFLLNIYCSTCRLYFDDVHYGNEEKTTSCPTCHSTIVITKKYSGFVYILSNEALNNTLKIGCTERPIRERINELSRSTSIPAPFILEACFYSDNHYADETNIHKALANFRINNEREFFALEISEATEIIEGVTGKTPFFIGEKLKSIFEKRDIEKIEKEKIKNESIKSNFNKEKYYCNKCNKYISQPSPTVFSEYALFWRDKCCPKCGTKLFITKK